MAFTEHLLTHEAMYQDFGKSTPHTGLPSTCNRSSRTCLVSFLGRAAKAALKQEQDKRLAEQQRLKAPACKPLSGAVAFTADPGEDAGDVPKAER